MPRRHLVSEDHECASTQASQRALGDDVVQQHRIDPAAHQVGVGVDVVVIRDREQAGRVTRCQQHVVGDRRAQRGDAAPTQIGQRANAIAIRRPHRQDLSKFEVGQGDGVAGATRRRILDAGEANFEIPAFDRLIDAGPLHLNETRRPAPPPEPARDAFGDLYIEAPHARRIGRVGFHKGGATLGISTPHEHAGVRGRTLRGEAY